MIIVTTACGKSCPRIYTKTDVDGFLWQVIPEGPGYQLSAGSYPSGIATGELLRSRSMRHIFWSSRSASCGAKVNRARVSRPNTMSL